MTIKKEVLNTPNNIIKGKIEIDAQINKLYYKILFNIQKQNRDYIIKCKKGDILTPEQEKILNDLEKIDMLKCKISIDEIKSIIKNKNEHNPEEYNKRFHALQGAVFTFSSGENNTHTQLIGRVEESESYYEISVDAKLYKYLFYSVGVGYTPINLAVLFNLKSQYSQNLYTLLRSWTGIKNKMDFKLSDLRFVLGVENKYLTYKSFKQKVLNTAINEINNSGAMEIEINKELRVGRSIDSIEFLVKDLEPKYVYNKEDSDSSQLVYWLDCIPVENENVIIAIETLLGENINYESPIVLNILKESFATTIMIDSRKEQLLTKKNIGLFIGVANNKFETNESLASKHLNYDDY